jgi:hypothetical protein
MRGDSRQGKLCGTAPCTGHEGGRPVDESKYQRDWEAYSRMEGADLLSVVESFPCLNDDTELSQFDSHYFYQDIWAARKVRNSGAPDHVDVGSRVDYVGFLTTITNVTFVDIRPLRVNLANFCGVAGSILSMPFDDGAVPSLSCLHVAEHIGLGRYGDPLDPLGTVKAAAELMRVLAPEGDLYFSLPIGRPRVCFNAHRIHSVDQILGYFEGLDLVDFSCVLDDGSFVEAADHRVLGNASYACGMFHFRKPAQLAESVVGSSVVLAPTTPPAEAQPIFCVGDSHVCFFTGQDKISGGAPSTGDDILPQFRTYWLGPILAYNLVQDGTTTQGREKLISLLQSKAIPLGSRILLSAGEIDCRMHLLKQAESQDRPIESVVEECVERYFSVILELKKSGWRPMVWAVVPSGDPDPDSTWFNNDFPHYGSLGQRNEAIGLFNRELERVSLQAGVPFISIYESICDEHGMQRTEFFMDPFHLSQAAMPLAMRALMSALEPLGEGDGLAGGTVSTAARDFGSPLKAAPPRIALHDSNFGPTDLAEAGPFEWDNGGGDRDVEVFTDHMFAAAQQSRAHRKVAWLLEPPAINSAPYEWIRINFEVFDAVFTYDRALLAIDSRFKFCPWGTTWILPEMRKIGEKSELCSIVASGKNSTFGHQLRHQIISRYGAKIGGVFGRAYRPLAECWEKVDALSGYAYSIAVENSRLDAYFTEKILDCFATGTVPIYWGCPTIGEYFDSSGILAFETLEELDAIMERISLDDYATRADAIATNLARVEHYASMKCNLWRAGLADIASESAISFTER